MPTPPSIPTPTPISIPCTPADATRFTSTGPHASAPQQQYSPHSEQYRPSVLGHTAMYPSSSTLASRATNGRGLVGEGGGGGGGGGGEAGEVKVRVDTSKEVRGWETAQARVARLRAAARKAKEQESATVAEKLYVHGRIWADRLHRATALGLIGATFICGGLTIYAFSQTIIHSRKLQKQYAEDTRRQQQQQQLEEDLTISSTSPPTSTSPSPSPSPPWDSVTPTIPAEQPPKGFIAGLKAWSLRGLTPAKDEYRDRDAGLDISNSGSSSSPSIVPQANPKRS